MKILAVETSAAACSCCVYADGKLLAQSFQDSGLTHSRTLMPLIDGMLSCGGIALSDIDVFAVSSGPGSFTGLRIGVSAVKGLAWAEEKPVCGVSTLEAMAWNSGVRSGRICCAMDARRKQVYNALFEMKDGVLIRLTEDRAISLEELFAEPFFRSAEPVTVVGDGAELCLKCAGSSVSPLIPAPAHLIRQSAYGTARAAEEELKRNGPMAPGSIAPNYLRLSQAERERLERQQKESETLTTGGK